MDCFVQTLLYGVSGCDIGRCGVADCNLDGIPDAIDIAHGTSLDANTDGTPDECQSEMFGESQSASAGSGDGDSTDAPASQPAVDPALQATLAALTQCIHDHRRRDYPDLSEREYAMVLLEAMCDLGYDNFCHVLRYLQRHGGE